MTTETLAELQKLAKPALRHAELVDLAKEKSPNKVYEIAVARWPKRQAKAARSLAQMRRDNPRAFEAYIATMEHARSAETDTEHAQERMTTMTAQLLKSINHLSDPVAKLRLAVKHNLKPQVAEMIASFAKDWQITFWCDEHTNDILFDTLVKVPKTYTDTTQPQTLEWARKHRNRILVAFIRPEETQAALVADLGGMVNFLGWKDAQTRDFVRPSLEHIAKREPTSQNWRMHEATTDVARKYLKADDEVAKAAERWVLLSRFRGGRIFELRRIALPVSQERPYKRGGLSDWEIVDELNPIVDRMLEVGMTMEEIREEFLKWITEKGKAGGCRYQFMLAVAGAKCFRDDHKSSNRRRELLRKYFLPQIVSEKDIFQAAREFVAFKAHGLEAWQHGDEKFFRPRVVDLLSHGNAGAVYQWLITHGHSVDFYPHDVKDVGRKAGMDASWNATAWEMMRVMAKEAVQLATKAERFGVAAALTQHFKDAATPKKVRELVQLALDLDQPIALAWKNSIEQRKEKE